MMSVFYGIMTCKQYWQKSFLRASGRQAAIGHFDEATEESIVWDFSPFVNDLFVKQVGSSAAN